MQTERGGVALEVTTVTSIHPSPRANAGTRAGRPGRPGAVSGTGKARTDHGAGADRGGKAEVPRTDVPSTGPVSCLRSGGRATVGPRGALMCLAVILLAALIPLAPG